MIICLKYLANRVLKVRNSKPLIFPLTRGSSPTRFYVYCFITTNTPQIFIKQGDDLDYENYKDRENYLHYLFLILIIMCMILIMCTILIIYIILIVCIILTVYTIFTVYMILI
jgi:hypothetical protein